MLFELADRIAKGAAGDVRRRVMAALGDGPESARDEAVDLATLLACAYPALDVLARPKDVAAIARGFRTPRDHRTYRRVLRTLLGAGGSEEAVVRALRLFARREKLRIAARELVPAEGGDVDVTSRELADLADVCCETALAHALAWGDERYGTPQDAEGRRCPIVVVGMGKLGGRELNVGSDVDLVLFYGTDDGAARGAAGELTLHEYFTRVSQRFIALLEEPTAEGVVWRVDMRLRPEGTRGPLVNALAAAERYYETWGRTWERAALVRARPVAGDLAFGARVLEALHPFVWRRAVDPRIASEMRAMLLRARAEAGHEVDRDLKIGRGGIREVEFFAQGLQLVWGGREAQLRPANTLDALGRLRTRGYVTDREARVMSDAYLFLRRLEHRIQLATGLQTHAIPRDRALLGTIARSLGFGDEAELEDALARTRADVASRFDSLTDEEPRAEAARALERLFVALDRVDEAGVEAWLGDRLAVSGIDVARSEAPPAADLARHLLALARRPDGLLGASTRDQHPELGQVLVDALLDAANPEQAARLMAAFFARLVTPGIYARALAGDPRAARRLASLFGASAFLGEQLVGHPELVDRLLFGRGSPSPDSAREALREELENAPVDLSDFIGGLRRAKGRVTLEVGLADLAGEIGMREGIATLTALADAELDAACRFAVRERGLDDLPPGRGLAVIGMGKLGGREIGYGSDLDIFFVYGDDGEDEDMGERFIRASQRVMRLLGLPHHDGPGYELDVRLRPSGNQGLLVVGAEAFARYHRTAQDWERQALVKARFCAGDEALAARVLATAGEAAYGRGAPPPERVNHLRLRMERELARERLDAHPARYDVKLGRGGLVDVEFATQWLQMKHGTDTRVRTTETEAALGALERHGYLDPALASTFAEGYAFLRRLEQRLRVVHGTSVQLVEEGAPGLGSLARRMGMRDAPRAPASESLLAEYLAVTRAVRAAYMRVLGLG